MRAAKIISALLWFCALGLGAWLLRDFPFSDTVASLRQVSAWQYIAWATINATILFLSCYRWQLLAKVVECRLSLWKLFLVRQAGQTISFITPGPQFGGEPIQVYWLCSRFGLSLQSAVMALGLDRLFELWVNFIVLLSALLLVLFALPWAAQSFSIGPVGLSAFIFTLFLIAYFAYKYRDAISGKLKTLLSNYVQSNVSTEEEESIEPIIPAQGYGQYIQALAISGIVWVGIFFELEFVLYILSINITHIETLSLLCAIRLAMLLPLPGGIGSIEAAILLTFQALAIEQELAFGLIALCRLRDASLLALGFWTLYKVQHQSLQNS